MNEIHAISRPVVDAKLRNTLANRLDVARVAKREPTDTNVDSSSRLAVAQACEPVGVILRLTDLDHKVYVSYGIQPEK
jgi:hypothetical protein